MEITHKTGDDLTAHITVNITEDDYAEEVKKSINDIRRKANIPGFRPGKVPFGMINKLYGEAIVAEKVNDKLNEALNNYFEKNSFQILGQPLDDPELQEAHNYKTDKDFTFNVVVGLKPEFDFDIDDKIKLKYHNITIADDAVDKYLDEIRKKFGKMMDVDTIVEGDAVFGDFVELDKDGNEVENGMKRENAYFNIDEIKLKGVKTNLMKLKVGESTVFNPARAFKNDVVLASFLGEGLAEAKKFKADIKFTLRHISHIEPAELNEELFKKVYEHDNIENEEQLRERILRDITDTYKWEARNQFLNDAVDLLVEKTDLDLPDEFLKRWIIESNKKEEEDKQIPADRIEEEYKNYRDTLRWQLIREKLIEKYKLQVSVDELRDKVLELMGISIQAEKEQEKDMYKQLADSLLENKEQREKILDNIFEDKLIALFKEKAKVEEVEISYDDFVNMVNDKVAEKAEKKK